MRFLNIFFFLILNDFRPGSLGNWRTGRDYPNDSIAKNRQNPETSPGDLTRFAVTQTPVKNHQLTLMGKTLQE